MPTNDMRAVVPNGPGGPEVLTLVRRPIPRPNADQVLIKTAYAGVNRHDCGQRTRGVPPLGATDVLGLEVSGYIADVGKDVAHLKIGDAVCALVNGGGYADYCIADAALVLQQASSLTLAEMAALPEALFTAWFNLFELAMLREGMSVLIHGGTSGVGSIAIQLAAAFHADVLATAGSREKCLLSERLGARCGINYRESDFVSETLSLTGGRGVDVILDMVGGAYLERNLKAIACDGTIVHLSSSGEGNFVLPLRQIMSRRARLTGALLRSLEDTRKREVAETLKSKIWPLLGTQIRPVVSKTYPLEQAEQAHSLMETGSSHGKLLLSM